MRILSLFVSLLVVGSSHPSHADPGRSARPAVYDTATGLASARAEAAAPAQPSANRPNPTSPEQRERVAARWAPTLYQETLGESDLITSFDFDGDWDGSNNAANVRRFPLYGIVYYTVAETATHWLITYLVYHPVDTKVPFGHDHDTEHVTLVVRRDGSDLGRVEAMETRFHRVLYQYAAAGAGVRNGADDVDGPIHFGRDGRPELYLQRVGHGICGGFSPPAFFNALSLTCRHHESPHIQERGVVYRYTGVPALPRSLDDRDVGYGLVEIGDTLWMHARASGPHATFSSLIDFQGERCSLFHCPHGIGGALAAASGHHSTGMPWEEGSGRGVGKKGDHFLDPAFTLARRLRFPAPFSLDYLYNPYLAIGDFPSAVNTTLARTTAR